MHTHGHPHLPLPPPRTHINTPPLTHVRPRPHVGAHIHHACTQMNTPLLPLHTPIPLSLPRAFLTTCTPTPKLLSPPCPLLLQKFPPSTLFPLTQCICDFLPAIFQSDHRRGNQDCPCMDSPVAGNTADRILKARRQKFFFAGLAENLTLGWVPSRSRLLPGVGRTSRADFTRDSPTNACPAPSSCLGWAWDKKRPSDHQAKRLARNDRKQCEDTSERWRKQQSRGRGACSSRGVGVYPLRPGLFVRRRYLSDPLNSACVCLHARADLRPHFHARLHVQISQRCPKKERIAVLKGGWCAWRKVGNVTSLVICWWTVPDSESQWGLTARWWGTLWAVVEGASTGARTLYLAKKSD